MKHFRFPTSSIQAICQHYKLGKPTHITYSKSGKVNPIIFVNDRYVIKVNVRDPQDPKLRREAYCMQQLKKAQVPVPELIALDESRTLLSYDFLIMTKIKGKEIHANWQHLNSTQKEKLGTEAGFWLAKIHQIQVAHYGQMGVEKLDFLSQNTVNKGQKIDKIANIPPLVASPFYNSWKMVIVAKMEAALKVCATHQLFTPSVRDLFLKKIMQYAPVLETVTTPFLVHNDYHFGNLLFQNDQITGIIDFEWAQGGDTDFDFRDPLTFADGWRALEKSYFSLRPRHPFFKEKMKLYQLLLYVQLSELAAQHWGNQAQQKYVVKATELLKQF